MRRAALAFGTAASVAIALAACGNATGGVGFGDGGADASAGSDAPGIDAVFPTPVDASLFEAGCAIGTARATKDPIYLLMVLDGSGSMAMDQKWHAVVPALGLFIDDIAMQKDPSFGIGLTIFSDESDPTQGKGPYPNVDVPIAFVDAAQAARLRARLGQARPKYDTPTVAVLQGQYGALASYAPSSSLLPGGKKVLVFLTDGVPFPDDGTQKAKSVQTTADAFARTAPSGPMTTLAVGVGYDYPYTPSQYDQKFVGQIAVAGGAPTPGCDPEQTWDYTKYCHFQVTPNGQNDATRLEQDFLLAFDKIRSRLLSCALTLEKVDGGMPVEPDKVNVVFTNDLGYQSIVPEDGTDGWTYDDPLSPAKVFLHGKSCDDLKANVHGKVDVVLGCKTIVR